MAHEHNALSEIISTLKQERDELAVRMHLAKSEAKAEWDKLDEKWAVLTSKYEPLKHAVGDSAEQLTASLKLVAGEIRDGFQRIRKSL